MSYFPNPGFDPHKDEIDNPVDPWADIPHVDRDGKHTFTHPVPVIEKPEVNLTLGLTGFFVAITLASIVVVVGCVVWLLYGWTQGALS